MRIGRGLAAGVLLSAMTAPGQAPIQFGALGEPPVLPSRTLERGVESVLPLAEGRLRPIGEVHLHSLHRMFRSSRYVPPLALSPVVVRPPLPEMGDGERVRVEHAEARFALPLLSRNRLDEGGPAPVSVRDDWLAMAEPRKTPWVTAGH